MINQADFTDNHYDAPNPTGFQEWVWVLQEMP